MICPADPVGHDKTGSQPPLLVTIQVMHTGMRKQSTRREEQDERHTAASSRKGTHYSGSVSADCLLDHTIPVQQPLYFLQQSMHLQASQRGPLVHAWTTQTDTGTCSRFG
jgi:hypothetical protein